jgi:hypothetical protein
MHADHRRAAGSGFVVLTDPEGNEFCAERRQIQTVERDHAWVALGQTRHGHCLRRYNADREELGEDGHRLDFHDLVWIPRGL